MRNLRKKILALLVTGLVAFGGFAGAAMAADVADTLDLEVEVVNECFIDVQDFSTQITGLSVLVEQANAGVINVQCNRYTDYSIAMDVSGQHFGQGAGAGGDSRRSMSNGAGEFLSYALYQDAGFQAPWGDGAFAQAGEGTGSLQQLFYHVAIHAPNLVSGGVYNDAVPVTLTYNE